MRGARDTKGKKVTPFGIIPADAGSTEYLNNALVLDKDHPRGCGVHSPCRRTDMRFGGSSPRMRGARRWKNAVSS